MRGYSGRLPAFPRARSTRVRHSLDVPLGAPVLAMLLECFFRPIVAVWDCFALVRIS
jgi:hypothetical protein